MASTYQTAGGAAHSPAGALTEAAARVILPRPMRRLAVLALLALAAGCSTDPCQELGERICACSPGATSDACEAQVESQLEDRSPGEDFCQARLDACVAPPDAIFCEWLLTADGKDACGLTPATAP